MNEKQVEAEAPVETAEETIHPCSVCPMRSTAQNETFGWCGGCTRVTRKCRGCHQNKPQADWGWGLLFGGLAAFLCADCRTPPDPDVCETHPRFDTQIEFGSDLHRYRLAEVLAAVARSLGPGMSTPANTALDRMAACLRTSKAGVIDIDVSDVPLKSREVITEALKRNVGQLDPDAERALRSLRWAWTVFVEDSKPQPEAAVPAPTVAEHSRQVNGEIWT